MDENIDIGKQTDFLIGLQEIDTQIYKMESEKELKPQEISDLNDSLQQKQSGMKDADDNLKAIQLKHKKKRCYWVLRKKKLRSYKANLTS